MLTAEKRQDLKQALIQFAASIGIDKIGFASADPFETLKERLIRHRSLGYESGFEEPDIEKRVYPEKTLPGPKSIIAIAIAYPSKMKHPPRSEPGAYRGMIARAAWGEDYHRVLTGKLEQLADFLRRSEPGARVEIMVDTGVLSDRATAERAGIGWVGKNCAVITPEYGSWVYLGEMITDIFFEPDHPLESQCGSCTRCIDACPTGALVQGGQLNAQRCISYQTQTKGFLADEFREKIGNRLYGCDTCQLVCPENKGKNWTHQSELQPNPEVVKPLLKPILWMSNREFKTIFGRSAASWRGKKPIQRNAIIALAHFKDKSAVPDLIQLAKTDPRPVIRGTAAWALGKIGGEEAEAALRSLLVVEEDETVRREIKKGLSLNLDVL
jgi:epoxyqueuosine reductase